MSWRKFKPGVTRPWLLVLAGLMWTAAGLMLCSMAFKWLAVLPVARAVILGVAGLALAAPVFKFGFSRIADRNIDRISRSPERPCLFSFQAWSGYLIIAVMIFIGAILRMSPLSRTLLAVVYSTIGGGLLFGSFCYYKRLWQILSGTDS